MRVKILPMALNILLGCLCSTPVKSQPAEISAEQAATAILQSFSNQEFKAIWDQKVSEWGKQNWSKDGFLASLSMSRPQLGKLQSMQVIAREHTNLDPSTGYQGDIYAITFKDKYTTGEFYERIVVVRDVDGQYRLSGFYGSPVPDK